MGAEWLLALGSIMLVNVVLSGDNAVVIALASRNLPEKQRKMAVFVGSGGAIVLRVLLTVVAVALLKVSYIQFFGGVLLIWIAAKLLMESKDGEEGIQGAGKLWAAVRTIILADLVMSLDNTLAIAAVAHGNIVLLGVGLALSVPLIIFGAQLIAKVMDRFPLIVYAGAGLIAWTAGKMMAEDPKLGHVIVSYVPEWVIPAAVTLGVMAIGYGWNHLHRPAREAV